MRTLREGRSEATSLPEARSDTPEIMSRRQQKCWEDCFDWEVHLQSL